MHEVKKLYRRINKKALHYRGSKGGDFCHQRHAKVMKAFEGHHLPMHAAQHGQDYTPLYKFLLSKTGSRWDDVFSEAVARLDKQEPIYYLVDLHPAADDTGFVRVDSNAYYSKLTVDEQGILVRLRPELTANDLPMACTCCTHSFNGVPYKK